jgi:hypothetical protein
MNTDRIIKDLKEKERLNDLVWEVIVKPSLLDDLFETIENTKSSIKFSCTKTIRLVSEKSPETVYPYFDQIVRLLQSENSFIRWDAVSILANLTRVDRFLKFDQIYDDYFDLIKGPQMITAANVIGNAWKIILAKPLRESDITRKMLKATGRVYLHKGEPSFECTSILCGHVIDCFDKYFETSNMKQEILSFVIEQLESPRKSVLMKAEKFLRKHNKVYE